MNRSHFRRGARATFDCVVCKRHTRHVENTDSELCHECWELAGHDNHHNDCDTVPTVYEMAFYDRLIHQAVKKGSDAKLMRANCPHIWRRK